jgi:N-acetylglucosaminyl-diphospho-decaprenol L-rhamnosyltransferase
MPPPVVPPPLLSISIVSYNTCRDLLACLASIFDHPPVRSFAVTVVDNGSVDSSVVEVRDRFPQVRVIETGENLGYGRANNRAMLGAPGDYYAVLNSDLVLRPGSLDGCCDYLDRHATAGIVGGALLNPDGTPQMDWAAGELTVRAIAFEQLFLAQLFPKSRVFGDYFRSWWPRDDTRSLPQVCGAFLVIQSELANRVGGFDEEYFMYCEDTDLCRRVRNAGLTCDYLHTAPAVHGHGKSSAGGLRAQMVLEHNRSRYLYMKRFFGKDAAGRARAIMILGARLRALLWTAAGVVLMRRGWIEKGQGYREVLAGTLRLGQ